MANNFDFIYSQLAFIINILSDRVHHAPSFMSYYEQTLMGNFQSSKRKIPHSSEHPEEKIHSFTK